MGSSAGARDARCAVRGQSATSSRARAVGWSDGWSVSAWEPQEVVDVDVMDGRLDVHIMIGLLVVVVYVMDELMVVVVDVHVMDGMLVVVVDACVMDGLMVVVVDVHVMDWLLVVVDVSVMDGLMVVVLTVCLDDVSVHATKRT